ncbi:MAG: ADOP family duplicated permease [Bacteroidales bacterium]
MLDRISRHAPHALRRLVTAPAFTLVIVVTLAIAIGANAAVFTLIDQLLLKPLPVSQPDTLVIVNAPSMPRLRGGSATIGGRNSSGIRLWAMNYSLFTTLTERVPVFQTTFATRPLRGTVLVGDAPSETWGESVTGNYFPALGIKAALGRLLGPTDDRPGSSSVVVLSHGYWQRQFGGDRSVIGGTIRIAGFPLTVVGVSATGFTGMAGARASDFFVPLEMCDTLWPRPAPYRAKDDGANFLTMMARLRAGTTIEQAQTAASQVYKQLLADATGRAQFSAKDLQVIAGYGLTLIPGGSVGSHQTGVSRQLLLALRLLMVMAVVLLLISAGNVTNLILAREVQRRREVAVRYALGASRARLLGERLAESLALAVASGGASLVVAAWVANALLVMLPISPEQTSVVTTPGRQTILFVAMVSVASGIVVWLASSIQATRRGALPPLSDSSTGEGPSHGLGFRRGLLVLQAALSLALLCGAAMLAHSLYNLTSVDPGFRTKGLTTFKLQPATPTTKAETFVQPLRNVLEALNGTSGVKSAAATTELPALEGGGGTWAVGGNVPVNAEKAVLVDEVSVTPGFFTTIGITVIRGRDLSAEDGAASPRVAVINESLAKALFGDRDPLGQMIGGQYQALDTRVVGIVKDLRAGVRQPASPALYEPWAQQPLAWASIIVRTRDDRTLDVPTIRRVAAQIDPSMPITQVSTLDGLISDAMARDRMLALLSSAIGGLAAFLCGLGLFAVMNYRVANRAREIGIRVALGAAARSVQWLIVREAFVVMAIGIPIGLAAYVASCKALGSLLFQLSPTDATTLASGVCLLALVALAAAFVPARRAARLDPAVTLRRE